MNDTLVEGNEAFSGAGILVTGGSTLGINRGEISRNIARNTSLNGKTVNGIAAGISVRPKAKVTLNSVTFKGNHADNSSGAIANCGLLTLTGSNKFIDNTAKAGGAIYNYIYNHERGQMEINGTTSFIGNAAEYGGVIYNQGDITITQPIFPYNNAVYGSAIYNEGDITDMGSIFWKNHAQYGTLYTSSAEGHLVMEGSVFMKNTADQEGGAIYSQSTLDMNNCDVTDNEAGLFGGGIFNDATGTLNLNGGRIERNEVTSRT
jgi:predicted outer membrane repeat protein